VEKRKSLNQHCEAQGSKDDMREPSYSSMYAISGSGKVYHLLYPDQHYTLCGFRVEKSHARTTAKALQAVEIIPPNRDLCKQCDKMNNRRRLNSGGPGSSRHNPESLLSGASSGLGHPTLRSH
jgi:hypothetical protein